MKFCQVTARRVPNLMARHWNPLHDKKTPETLLLLGSFNNHNGNNSETITYKVKYSCSFKLKCHSLIEYMKLRNSGSEAKNFRDVLHKLLDYRVSQCSGTVKLCTKRFVACAEVLFSLLSLLCFWCSPCHCHCSCFSSLLFKLPFPMQRRSLTCQVPKPLIVALSTLTLKELLENST